MDPRSKLAVIGAAGLVAVAICCAVVLTRRVKESSSGPSTTHKAVPRSSTASRAEADDETESDKTADKDDDDRGGGGSGGDDDNKEDPVKDAAVEGSPAVAAAPSAGTVGGGDAGKQDKGETGSKADEAEDREALVLRFNSANSKAKKFFSGQRYALAAEHYGIALDLCDKLPHHDDKRTALHNNRGAAYEKDGQYALALADCAMCLSREAGHKFARLRKSRVLEALGKEEDALSEVCAHLLLERDRVQAKAALTPSEPLTPPPPPENLERLLQKVASKRADEILAERKEKEAKEEAEGKAGTGKPKPLVKQAATELIRSFGSFSRLERRYKGMQEAAVTRELKDTEEACKGGDDSAPSDASAAAVASRISCLFDRGMLRLIKRNYDGSREDIFEAAKLLSTLADASATSPSVEGVSADVQASVWEWRGTYLQLAGGPGSLDRAMEAYERCGKVMETEGQPYPADCLIKMAWVKMDKEDTAAAKALFKRAMEDHPGYGTSYAHRARLGADGEGEDVVQGFLEKAIELNGKDVFAWEQLGRLHVQAGDIPKTTAVIEKGLKAVPKSDVLLTLKAELKYSMAMKAGDASSCMEILELFDAAIRANPSSPVLYLNKGSFLLQMMSDVGGAMEMLEKGVSVDSTSVNALVQLANLKIMVAREMADAESAVALIDKAVALCTTKEELLETLSVRVATEGRIKGARLLGRTTLA